jgi:hypothetical protein
MKRFLLYLFIFTLSLPSTGGGMYEYNKRMTIVEKSQQLVIDKENFHSRHMNVHTEQPNTLTQVQSVNSAHDCCNEDNNSSEGMLCCDNNCLNCDGDCSGNGLGLLNTGTDVLNISSLVVIIGNFRQPSSHQKNQLRPPIY